MTFREFLHRITTSRYTRRLEEENARLQVEASDLRSRGLEWQTRNDLLRDHVAELQAEIRSMSQENANRDRIQQPGRPRGKFVSFSQEKRRLESQNEPPRSVNV